MQHGAQLDQRVSGVDAAFTVDGISMTRSSNSVDDLFDGFTLDLKKHLVQLSEYLVKLT